MAYLMLQLEKKFIERDFINTKLVRFVVYGVIRHQTIRNVNALQTMATWDGFSTVK